MNQYFWWIIKLCANQDLEESHLMFNSPHLIILILVKTEKVIFFSLSLWFSIIKMFLIIIHLFLGGLRADIVSWGLRFGGYGGILLKYKVLQS